jgi:hypothetical protein
MLRIEINDPAVESAIKERSLLLHAAPETVLIRAAAESLGLPLTANKYNLIMENHAGERVAVPA